MRATGRSQQRGVPVGGAIREMAVFQGCFILPVCGTRFLLWGDCLIPIERRILLWQRTNAALSACRFTRFHLGIIYSAIQSYGRVPSRAKATNYSGHTGWQSPRCSGSSGRGPDRHWRRSPGARQRRQREGPRMTDLHSSTNWSQSDAQEKLDRLLAEPQEM